MSGKNTLTHQIQQTGTLTQRMQRIFPNKIFSCCIQFCPFLNRLLFPSSFYLQVFFRASIGLLQASSKVFSAKYFKFFKKISIFFTIFKIQLFYKFVFHRFQSNQSERKNVTLFCTCILHVISALEIKDIG